ncbi:hypothetical protein JZ751_002135 [Albula glossodonta]|uniref:Mastermind-like protein 2 n=1 Tax=Albula glossodonta TaxID=121402 RepID=A0A8T2P904_9TELE|nr:hypothetical protein JZ751_002135 [Albula glossodonta]
MPHPPAPLPCTMTTLSPGNPSQGSLRRKIEGHPHGYTPKQNGLAAGSFGSDLKRLRVEEGVLGHSGCAFGNGASHQSLQGVMLAGHSQKAKDMRAHSVQSDHFAQTLKEMKKEPVEVLHCCGQSSQSSSSDTTAMMASFDFKDEGGGQIDPELQDLFDELTKSVPSLSDLEFEKMLKQDEAFHLDLGRPASVEGAKPCSQLEKVIKSEYSPPGYCETSNSLPQMRPASAGPALPMATTSLAGQVPKNSSLRPQCPTGASRPLSAWQEVSHAEQLKQMAANQQPTTTLLHHHQQSQPGAIANWSSAITTHSSPGPFSQEKIPGLSIGSSSQVKEMNNCLFKSNGQNGGPSCQDLSILGSKPMLHFSPKVQAAGSQQVAHMAGPQGKQQQPLQQQSSAGPNHSRTQPHFPNPISQCLQPKSLPQKSPTNPHSLGLQFTPAQQRQVLPPGSHLSTVSTFLNGPATQGQTQQQTPTPNNPQKPAVNTQAIHRQLAQPQQINNDSPLPSTVSSHNGLQTSSCHLATGQATKMTLAPSDRRFVSASDPQHGSYGQTSMNQLQQHCSIQNRMGLNQNKPRYSGPSNQGSTFGSGTMMRNQLVRPAASQQVSGVPGPRLGSVVTGPTLAVTTSWAQGPKQNPVMDVRRFPSSLLPHHQGKVDMNSQKFTHRPPVPTPNQVIPDVTMLPPGLVLNGQAAGGNREPRPQLNQPRMPPLPSAPSINQGSPLQTTPATNSFSPSGHHPRAYQSGNSGTLTFDFLQEGDNTVPGINTDSDYIDSLLKSGSSNDDWMKDINLDEILGSQS